MKSKELLQTSDTDKLLIYKYRYINDKNIATICTNTTCKWIGTDANVVFFVFASELGFL